MMAVVALSAMAQVERPKLVVGLVVDQMRWDYLYNYQWGEGGFKTLLQDGYLCNNTIIDYVPTVHRHRCGPCQHLHGHHTRLPRHRGQQFHD